MNIFKCFKKEEPVMEPEPTPVMEMVSSHVEHPQPPEYFIFKIGNRKVAEVRKNKEIGRWYFKPNQFPIESSHMMHIEFTHDFTQEEIEMILEKLKGLNGDE